MADGSSSSSSGRPRRRRVGQAPVAGRDRLTSLPPCLLDIILARLPFKELVRTSGLSTAWRRRWESLPGLDIWFSQGFFAAPSDSALQRCAAPVRSFTARVPMAHFERADGWLRALAGKRVEKLTLELDDSISRVLGEVTGVLLHALFSHRELVHLDLGGCCYIPCAPRGFGGFPNLVTLVLNRVRLPFYGGGAQLGLLISLAPHLTELSLNDVRTTHFQSGAVVVRCDIKAPNLRVLKLIMVSENGCRVSEELPLLEKAVISIDCLLGTQQFIDTFRRIASVKEFCFRTDSRKCNKNPLEGVSCQFRNLRVATLATDFGKLSSIISIFSLLRCAPHIEKLEIEVKQPKWKDDPDIDDEDYLDPDTDDEFQEETVDDVVDENLLNKEASDDLFVGLKHVSLNGYHYIPNQIHFMKFLLSKTGSLESFVVTVSDPCVKETLQTNLATWRKASPQAKLSVSLRKSQTQT